MTYAQTGQDPPLRAGDVQALEEIYDAHAGLVYGLALRIVADPGGAEEVVQDVFLTLWRKPDSYDPARGGLRTWLASVARNRAIDRLRRSARTATAGEVPEQFADTSLENDPWTAVALNMEQRLVREAIDDLPAAQRQAIELAYFSGLTHTEIAGKLELPVGTVKGRLRLAMEKMHSYLSARGYTAGEGTT